MSPELRVALEAVNEASKLVLDLFEKGIPMELKEDDSPITRADREAELLLRERLCSSFPDYGFIGEEFEETLGDGGTRWVVDPIDGTQSFVHGVPLFAVVAGLETDGNARLGVVAFPALKMTVWAERGEGAFANGEPIHVSGISSISEATILSGSVVTLERKGKLKGFLSLASQAWTARTWGDAYGHCMIARGKADVMLDPRVESWDTCAVSVIVEEAGGRMTDFWGRPGYAYGEAISTNGLLHDRVLEAFNEDRGN
jgi:histidinol-phosphatase